MGSADAGQTQDNIRKSGIYVCYARGDIVQSPRYASPEDRTSIFAQSIFRKKISCDYVSSERVRAIIAPKAGNKCT
jgi:hypothetical protein